MSDRAHYVYFVEPGDSLSAIVRDALGPFDSHREWMETVKQVAEQSFIADPDRIRPAQPVVLRSSGPRATARTLPLPRHEVEQLHRVWRGTSAEDKELVREHWDVLDWLGHGNNAVGATAGAGAAVMRAELGRLRPPAPRTELILREQIHSFRQTLIRVRGNTVAVFRREGIVRTVRPILRLVPDRAATARYAARLRTLTARARGLRWLGRGSLGLSLGLAGYTIHQDWDTPNRTRTAVSQVVGISGAAMGGTLGYAVCSVGLGLPTGGHSLWICAMISGAVAGSTLGELGLRGAETAYDLFSTREARSKRDAPGEFCLEPMPLPALR